MSPAKALFAALMFTAVLFATLPATAAESVKIGITRTATDIAIYAADKRGYFKAAGIDVTLINVVSASAMLAPMASGDLDAIAGSASAGLFNATSRGLDIRLVASKVTTPKGFTSQTLIARKEAFDAGKITKIADLKGQKIANGSVGTGALGTLNRMLRSGGLTLKDVDLVSLAFPQMLPALKNGAVAATLPAEPYTMQAIREGLAVPLMRDDEVYPDHEIASFLFSGKFILERREVAYQFLKALIRGARDHNDALDDKGMLLGSRADSIIAILNEYTGVGGTDPEFFKRYALAYCNPDGTINAASLREDLALFRELGLIEGEASVEKLIDDSLRQRVITELGPYRKAR